MNIVKNAVSPTFSDATYQWSNQPDPKPYKYGDKIPLSKGEYFDVNMQMHLPKIHPIIWNINPDDCLEKLSINGTVVAEPNIPNCDDGDVEKFTLNLHPYLRTGANHLQMRLKNSKWDAGVWIYPFRFDPLMLLPKFLVGVVVLGYGFWCFSFLGSRTRYKN